MKKFMKGQDNNKACLACRDGLLGETLFKIEDLPLVDSFTRTRGSALEVPRADISIKSCNRCGTVQIAEPVDTSMIYREYIYESSSSPDLVDHFAAYAKSLRSNGLINHDSHTRIIEIGINDGLLAKHIIDISDSTIIGIDPSPQSKRIEAISDRIEIINDFFSESLIERSTLSKGSIDLIIANNVLSHIPYMDNVLSVIFDLLSDTGSLVFEIQSVAHLLERAVFDYIYHEHIFYHSLSSLKNILGEAGLFIYDIEFSEAKGGSYRIYAKKSKNNNGTQSLRYFEYYESLIQPGSHASWAALKKHLEHIKQNTIRSIEDFLSSEANVGKIIGYGACATGTVLQRYLDIEQYISGIADDNPKRQGLFSPGFGVPVHSSESIRDEDLVIVLAWRHFHYFRHKLSSKKFVLPLGINR